MNAQETKVYMALGFAQAFCCEWEAQGKRVGDMEVPLLAEAWEKANADAPPAEPEGELRRLREAALAAAEYFESMRCSYDDEMRLAANLRAALEQSHERTGE